MADEAVAAREILLDNYDALLVVGSAMSPEQTMYLLLQVFELGKPHSPGVKHDGFGQETQAKA